MVLTESVSSTPPSPAPLHGPVAQYLANPGELTHRMIGHLAHLANPATIGVAIAGLGLFGCSALALGLVRRRHAARIAQGARAIRILVPPEVEPESARVFWTKIVSLLRPGWRRFLGDQPYIGFEMTASATGLELTLWVPESVPPGFIESAVQAAWPGAMTKELIVEPPLPLGAPCEGGSLRLATAEWYPIRSDHDTDPYRLVLGTLSSLDEDHAACVQVLVRPVTGRRISRVQAAASMRRCGRPTTRAARLVDLLTPGTAQRPAASDPMRSGDVAAMLSKVAGPCFAVQIRYGVTDTARNRPDHNGMNYPSRKRGELRGRAHDLASTFSIYSGRNHLARKRLRRCDARLAARAMGKGDLVSIEELCALAHLPLDASIAGLSRAGAKAIAPPPEVVSHGKVLGDAEVSHRRPVALAVADARHHLHVMGNTGSGKSTLLTNLVLGDIDNRRGVVVIDPKGDLVTDVLDRMGPTTAPPVIIDPGDADSPPVMNVLDGQAAEHDLIVDNLVGIFRRIFEAYWGPRTDDVLRASCLTLLRHAATNGRTATLADVPSLLTDPVFRASRTGAVATNATLKGFWDSYEAMGEAQRAQVIGPVMNKLRTFLLRDFVSHLIGPTPSSFDMDKVLNGGILLVRIPKGILGEETTKLLGSFVLAKVWQAATHRARLGQEARVDASLYVDECQNFLNLPRSFEEMLAEARGYRLSLVLAHQHLAQFPKDLRDGVSANARSKVFFSLSPEDAHVLSRHTSPTLTEHDLSHLGAFQVAARLVVDGAETGAFTLRTRAATAPRTGQSDIVRDASRQRYGRSAAEREKSSANPAHATGRHRFPNPEDTPPQSSAT